jgi:hypothetical protein
VVRSGGGSATGTDKRSRGKRGGCPCAADDEKQRNQGWGERGVRVAMPHGWSEQGRPVAVWWGPDTVPGGGG